MNTPNPKDLRDDYKHTQIKGLYIIPNFLSTEEMDRFVSSYCETKTLKTSVNLPNTTVIYNYFSPFKKTYTPNNMLTPPFLELADKARRICVNLQLQRFAKIRDVPEFNNCVVNEYFSEYNSRYGDLGSIKWNLCTTDIGPFIVSYTFSDARVVYFTDIQTHEIVPIALEKGSFFILSGDARWKWHHSVETYDITHKFTRDIRYITLKSM